jgi:hypothetical protein
MMHVTAQEGDLLTIAVAPHQVIKDNLLSFGVTLSTYETALVTNQSIENKTTGVRPSRHVDASIPPANCWLW